MGLDDEGAHYNVGSLFTHTSISRIISGFREIYPGALVVRDAGRSGLFSKELYEELIF